MTLETLLTMYIHYIQLNALYSINDILSLLKKYFVHGLVKCRRNFCACYFVMNSNFKFFFIGYYELKVKYFDFLSIKIIGSLLMVDLFLISWQKILWAQE